MITEEKIRKIVRTNLEELYGQKMVDQLIDKFQQENPDLDPQTINAYINRFQQVKDSPKIVEKDITRYSWDDLEDLIVSNQPKPSTKSVNKQEDTIYNDNGLEILLGNTKDACIMYGEGYRFCISARGERNAFDVYREDNTIYFIIDHDRSKEKDEEGMFIDPYHLIVAMPNELLDFTAFTDANNKYITPASIGLEAVKGKEVEWEDIERIQPKLKGLGHLFKFVDADQKHYLKNRYQIELEELLDQFPTLFPEDGRVKKYVPFYELTKNSWELVNSIFNKGRRYILYDEDGVPQYGEIKIDNEPKDEWFERVKHQVPQMTKDARAVGSSATVTDLNDYPKEYKQYVEQVKQLMKEYYRKLSILK